MTRAGLSLTIGLCMVAAVSWLALAEVGASARRDVAHVGVTAETSMTLDVLAVREGPDSSPADKKAIVAMYGQMAAGAKVAVKRVRWTSVLATPFGPDIGMSQLNPNRAPVYAVFVTGAPSSGGIFGVFRSADRGSIFEAALISSSQPSWYRALRDLD